MGNYRLRVSTGQMAAVAGLLRGLAGDIPPDTYSHNVGQQHPEIGLRRAAIIAIVGGHCH
jgi:hypothetical protein